MAVKKKMDKVEEKHRQRMFEKETFGTELDDLDARISRIRVLYDQYFMGIERMEPRHLRSAIEKIFRRSKIALRGNTAQKFRFRSLQQRFISLATYWDRISRLIEDGKIRRGIGATSIGLRQAQAEPRRDGSEDKERVREAPAQSLAQQRRRFRKREEPELAAPPAQPEKTDFAPAEVDALYQRLKAEKSRVGEPTDKVTRSVIEKSVNAIVNKMPGKELAFRIIEKDGKVSLTAVLKKK
jgi:hypothetical protein